MKIVQTLEDSNILLKGITKTNKNETKEQKGRFLSMLLGTLGSSLLANLLTGKGTIAAGEGIGKNGYGSSVKNKSFNSTTLELRFSGVYSRDNLPKTIKSGAYVINLNEYTDVGPHWIALYVKNNEVIYFDSFGVEHVLIEIKKFIRHKSPKTNIFRIQADNSKMRGYFCIGFFDFMFENKSLIDFTSLFSPNDFKKSDKIILSYFKK